MPSFSRAQSLRFAAQGARERREVNADPAKTAQALYEGKRLCVSRTSIEHRRDIESGGFEQQPGSTFRVDMASHPWFLPTEQAALEAVGKVLTIEGQSLKIVSAKRLPLAGEIVLTLGKP